MVKQKARSNDIAIEGLSQALVGRMEDKLQNFKKNEVEVKMTSHRQCKVDKKKDNSKCGENDAAGLR